MVDAASGEETTIFPNHRTPDHLRDLYTIQGGGVAISPDRRRALVTFTEEGKAVEVRIADGAVLVVFHSLHDVSHLERLPEERATRAMWSFLSDVRYAVMDEARFRNPVDFGGGSGIAAILELPSRLRYIRGIGPVEGFGAPGGGDTCT